ncbi:MAG: shikimate dehydrogenase [Verrucomicrobia bacterium]|nr:MAG: shikimate dehydrogenase [Verrucomicrobiota bacterium]
MKSVYQIEDLGSRSVLDDGHELPAILAVIGQPIAHSASPIMHQAALEAAQIRGRYIRLEVAPGRVADAVARMRELGFRGCNVTVPHKLEAMECCAPDMHATQLGAVNTLVFDSEKTIGYNTDGPGLQAALRHDFGDKYTKTNVLLLGAAGGAGRAIACQLALDGVQRLVLVNRSTEKLPPLIDHLKKLNSSLEVHALCQEDDSFQRHCHASDLIINASSVGLRAGDSSILHAADLRAHQLVYDIIYQPSPTPLLAMACSVGCKTSNGLSMLIAQGALAFQHWFAGTDPLATMQQAMAHFSAAGSVGSSKPR